MSCSDSLHFNHFHFAEGLRMAFHGGECKGGMPMSHASTCNCVGAKKTCVASLASCCMISTYSTLCPTLMPVYQHFFACVSARLRRSTAKLQRPGWHGTSCQGQLEGHRKTVSWEDLMTGVRVGLLLSLSLSLSPGDLLVLLVFVIN